MMRKWLIGMGICQLIVSVSLAKLGYRDIKEVFDIVFILVGPMLMVIRAQKY